MKISHYCFTLLIFCFFTTSLYAQDFAVPSSWEKVAEAQDGDIFSIAIRDGWIAWMEKRLDPATQMNRTQSFFVGLYRKKIETGDIEILIEPNSSRTWGDQFVLGKNGIVSANYRGAYRQLLFPLKPVSSILLCPEEQLPRDPMMMGNTEMRKVLGKGENTPVRIYTNTILCTNGSYGKKGLSLIPFDGVQLNLNQKQIVVEPNCTEFIDACWDGNYVLYSHKHSLLLFDTTSQKNLLTLDIHDSRVRFNNLRLKDGFFYFVLDTGSPLWIDKIFRFSITNKTLEQLPMPESFVSVLDFGPEKAIGCYRRPDGAHEILETNLISGEIKKYDIPLYKSFHWEAGDDIANARYFLFDTANNIPAPGGMLLGPQKNPIQNLSYCGDAASGKVLAAFKNILYLIPKINDNHRDWPSFGWTSKIEDELKDQFTIRDENNKKIQIKK